MIGPLPTVRRRRIYILVGAISLAAAVIGFMPTFFIPLAKRSFAAPPVVFVHGALAFAWVLLFSLQPALIRAGRHRLHVQLGTAGAALAIALFGTGLAVGSYSVSRDLAAGMGQIAISSIVGTVSSLVMYLALVAAGFAHRSNPGAHKRFLLLATVLVTWPAWFRFRHYFPSAPHPEIVFAFAPIALLIIAVMLADWHSEGRVHRVYAVWGTAIIVEQVGELLLFDTAGWRAVGQVLYSWLG